MSDSLPPEPFAEPAEARDTEPPLNPAVLQALRDVVRQEVRAAFGAFMTQWGSSHVALNDAIGSVKETSENAIRLGAERERMNLDRFAETHENIRAVRTLLELPEYGSVAELAALAAAGKRAGE